MPKSLVATQVANSIIAITPAVTNTTRKDTPLTSAALSLPKTTCNYENYNQN